MIGRHGTQTELLLFRLLPFVSDEPRLAKGMHYEATA
jgi:hypothetical protein